MTRRYRCAAIGLLAWTAASLLAAAPATAQIVLDAIPGGVVEIPLASASQPQPQAFFGQNRTLVARFGSRWVSLLGLPLDLVPGTYVMQARLEEGADLVTREFTVYPRRLRDHPVVSQPELPIDSPAVPLVWRDALDAEFPLDSPVSVAADPLFGRYRRLSESGSRYVKFVRFTIASDISVKTPGSGIVAAVETDDSGSYVWIDHGMGLFTCLGPLTRTPLRPSDTIRSGESAGKIVLEKVDEPVPLFLSVYLNGTAVNPFLVSDIKKPDDSGARDGPGDESPDG